MQTTRYEDTDGNLKQLTEVFDVKGISDQHSAEDKLRAKMNQRLFELETRGHTLVEQRMLTLSEKLQIERAKKAKEKIKRMDKVF